MIATYTPLIEQLHNVSPDLIQLTAIASVLHSFYNGVERAFVTIAKQIDEWVPAGAAWHRELLDQMTQTTPQRPAILSSQTARNLEEFLAFKHSFRHAYSFLLSWNKIEQLVPRLHTV